VDIQKSTVFIVYNSRILVKRLSRSAFGAPFAFKMFARPAKKEPVMRRAEYPDCVIQAEFL
jgi:hypothetical protein